MYLLFFFGSVVVISQASSWQRVSMSATPISQQPHLVSECCGASKLTGAWQTIIKLTIWALGH